MRIRTRYTEAEPFPKPAILKLNPDQWCLVGPGLHWLGECYLTWDEAIEAFRREYNQ